jgi:hypothetical protein
MGFGSLTWCPASPPSRSLYWQAARDQVTSAADVIAADTADLAGTIGRQALPALLPARRQRVSPRIVKRAISKYQARGKPDRTSYKATISTSILSQQGDLTADISPELHGLTASRRW